MPELKLEFDFNHPADQMFDIVRRAENHRRYMPLCKESHVAPESRGSRSFVVDYLLAKKKYGFERQMSARFQIDLLKREIVVSPAAEGSDWFTATCRITFEDRPDGKSHAVAHIDYSAGSGALRLIPLGPFVKRAFQKVMAASEKRASRLVEKASENAAPHPDTAA